MSNYSPYNKTYRYILYQNQAYHIKNKRSASPEVRTNIRHSMSRISPIKDAEAYMYRSTKSQSTTRTSKRHNEFLRDNQIKNVIIDKPAMHVHKNQSYEKFQQERINGSNHELVSRMVGTGCTVVKKSKALHQYERHIKYSQIRARYDENRQRKDTFSLGKKSMLCPTLSEFVKSGLANMFMKNLSVINDRRPSNLRNRKQKNKEC